MITAVSYQFERFLDFAEERVKAGKESAIARKGDGSSVLRREVRRGSEY